MPRCRLTPKRSGYRAKLIGPLAVIIATSFFWPCEAENPPAEAVSGLPTATEVFHLRSECAALGRRILDRSLVGSTDTQSQVSHYDPKSNRCYVQLTVNGHGQTFNETIYLLDGQTEEMLAALHHLGNDKSGLVYDRQHKNAGNPNAYDDTKAYIDTLMNEGQR
jgi:hypothetical protein